MNPTSKPWRLHPKDKDIENVAIPYKLVSQKQESFYQEESYVKYIFNFILLLFGILVFIFLIHHPILFRLYSPTIV